jgi:N-acetylglucosaminyldiphosphoundecaprenol N-acetyl-beta-D-mannosaminyltransferase
VVCVIDLGKRNVLGILIDAVDYEAATAKVIAAARDRRPYAVSALAVHGVMTGARDDVHSYRLNRFDLLTPDGQPVRWALNMLHGTRLPDRVYGPTLMLSICRAAAEEGLPVFLYGSAPAVLERLVPALTARIPRLRIAGAEPSRFRRTSEDEKRGIAKTIRDSGAQIVFVGLGCPRQEVFAYEYRDTLSLPTVAVGAAFDYHAGLLREPPQFVQRAGLQWLHRLAQDPRRLWRRYTFVNAAYVAGVLAQLLRLSYQEPVKGSAPEREVLYG